MYLSHENHFRNYVQEHLEEIPEKYYVELEKKCLELDHPVSKKP